MVHVVWFNHCFLVSNMHCIIFCFVELHLPKLFPRLMHKGDWCLSVGPHWSWVFFTCPYLMQWSAKSQTSFFFLSSRLIFHCVKWLNFFKGLCWLWCCCPGATSWYYLFIGFIRRFSLRWIPVSQNPLSPSTPLKVSWSIGNAGSSPYSKNNGKF